MKQISGVSIVICCYNSASRLRTTLSHLTAQRGCKGIPWEVIVVDNASSDDTADAARNYWPKDAPAPLRVVYEQKQGLSNARRHGFAEARYEYISFVDDDNWVDQDWVKTIAEIMDAHPNAGACGGISEAAFEAEPPEWFTKFCYVYAVSVPDYSLTDEIQTKPYLWGAGLTVRSSAYQALSRKGFLPFLSDRNGSKLTAGGDIELCYALRLAGWDLLFTRQLRLIHFMPKARLRWKNMRNMMQGVGASRVILDLYLRRLDKKLTMAPYQTIWFSQMISVLITLIKYAINLRGSYFQPHEGNETILGLEVMIGSIKELFRLFLKFGGIARYIFQADLRRELSQSS